MGVAKDLSHIETKAKVKGYCGTDEIGDALKCSNIVLIPAGVPRKPGMTRADLFDTNAGIVRDLVKYCGECCPEALIGIITNPVNSTIPVAAEVLKKVGAYDPRRLFGISTLDTVRANTFIAELCNLDPSKVNCPVVGGHSGITIVPVISQCTPKVEIDKDKIPEIIKKVQEAGTEVVKAKAGGGSATLAMAYAGARFANSMMKGLKGDKNIIECSFVAVKCQKTKYLATQVLLGKCGIEKDCGIPELNSEEKKLFEIALCDLEKEIKKGEDFVKKSGKKKC